MKDHSNAQAEREYRRASERPDDGNAFIPDVTGQHKPLAAADAEALAEEFIGSATGGESVSEDAQDEVIDEEEGGPFLILGEDGQLPPEPDERDPELEGHEAVHVEQALRGARWAARGV